MRLILQPPTAATGSYGPDLARLALRWSAPNVWLDSTGEAVPNENAWPAYRASPKTLSK